MTPPSPQRTEPKGLCADRHGAVWAVPLDCDEEQRFVNSSTEAFASCLVELGDALRVSLATDQPAVASSAFEHVGPERSKRSRRARTLHGRRCEVQAGG